MTIQDISTKTIPIFEQYGITYAALFGSYARGEEATTSDVDIMVKIGQPMGIFKFMQFVEGLESSLGRKVDVVTERSINRHVLPYITADLKTIYEK